jgi:murein DD-endopeptidase MepM/ murein hydrolase activator NlpD
MKMLRALRSRTQQIKKFSAGVFLITGMLLVAQIHQPSPIVLAETLEKTLTPSQVSTDSLPTPDFGEETPMPVPAWGNSIYEIPLALTSHDHFYFNRPLSLSTPHKINTDYRYGYYYPDEDVVHTGLDISGNRGDPVLAAAPGKVIFAGFGLLNGANDKKDPYGLAVMIRHSFSFNGYTIYSVYAHLDKVTVSRGDWVESGYKIGTIGMTGATSGPHLHFEIRLENAAGDKVQNPELWMAPLVDHGVLTGRIETSYGLRLTTKTLWLKSLETGKTWSIITYAPKTKQVDDYYNENFTVGDLPLGEYEISIYYNGIIYKQNIFISPGAVNYIKFHGNDGFTIGNIENPPSTSFLNPGQ